MFVGLHVYAEIALGRGRIVAHLASVRFITARVRLAAGQSRVRLSGNAVHARRFRFRVFFLHMYLQRFLILVMPVALGALERFTRVPRVHAHQRTADAAGQPGRAEYELATSAIDSARPAVHVVRAYADRRAGHKVGWRLRVR